MSYLYVTDNGAYIGVNANYVYIKKNDIIDTQIPIETLEEISIFGRSQITTQCVQACLHRGIPILYYSKNREYFGRLQPGTDVNVARQRVQATLIHTDLALQLTQKIISSKIHNQYVLLHRYANKRNIDIKKELLQMKIFQTKVMLATAVDQIMGYEGSAARSYFSVIGKIMPEEFAFNKRTRRPPTDPFNTMLSFGYSLLMNEVYGKIEAKGLNPYFGFMHQDKEKHPTLASELMEEWRAVIVDSVVLGLVNGREILPEHFRKEENGIGIYLTREGRHIFLNKFEKKMRQETRYLATVDYAVSYRRALELQVNDFCHLLEQKDVEAYQPIWIR